MKNIEPLLKAARKGDLKKLQQLYRSYNIEAVQQALRASVVNNQASCVAYLAPLVAVSTQNTETGLTLIENTLLTAIVFGNLEIFDLIHPYCDVSKKNSIALKMACKFENQAIADRVLPASDVLAVWHALELESKHEKIMLSPLCLDIIRPYVESVQQRQRLEQHVCSSAPSAQRKM